MQGGVGAEWRAGQSVRANAEREAGDLQRSSKRQRGVRKRSPREGTDAPTEGSQPSERVRARLSEELIACCLPQ
eukprot:2738037-Pleurochrysis_carterae.AAC.1